MTLDVKGNVSRPRPGTAPLRATRSIALRPPIGRASAQLSHAEKQGLLIREVALEDIEADALVRDRVVLDEVALEDLRASIERNGVRLRWKFMPTRQGSRGPVRCCVGTGL